MRVRSRAKRSIMGVGRTCDLPPGTSPLLWAWGQVKKISSDGEPEPRTIFLKCW